MRDNDKHYYLCSLYLDSLSDITLVYEQAYFGNFGGYYYEREIE